MKNILYTLIIFGLYACQANLNTPIPTRVSPTSVPPTQTITPTPSYDDYVTSLSLSPDGKTIVIGTSLKVFVLDGESMNTLMTIPISNGISQFSADGSTLYLSGFNSQSLLLKAKTWEASWPYLLGWNYLRYGAGIKISPNEKTFAFASGGTLNECDGAHRAFEIHNIANDEILYRQINCAHYAKIVYKYNKSGDLLFWGNERADFQEDQSAPNQFAIIDTQNGSVIKKFRLTEPVIFIEDELGIVYLREHNKSEFLLWDMNSEKYIGNSNEVNFSLNNGTILTIPLDNIAYITSPSNQEICKVGKMYATPYDRPEIFEFIQENKYLVYSNFYTDEIFYWDIENCQLINRIKLSDIKQ